MTQEAAPLCDDTRMSEIVAAAGSDPEAAIGAIDAALSAWPDDHRLHFLKGSLMIGLKRFIGAHSAMAKAVALAPEFAIARFQLGFFELTSGEADAAKSTWQPLKAQLPAEHWMLYFVDGLEHLAADRFAECILALRHGIEHNTENLPLNTDMSLIIEKCAELLGNEGSAPSSGNDEISATSFLLGNRTPRH